MTIGLIGFALILIANGAPLWVLGLLALVAVGLTFLMEHVLPYERAWNNPHRDASKDTAHGLVYEAEKFIAMLLLPTIVMLMPWEGFWPRDWPLWAQFLVALVVADASMTLTHYVSHKVHWLWRLHSVHHGVHRLYGLNGLIRHPMHQAFDLTFATLPLMLAGMPLNVGALLGFAVTVQLLLQHSNVDYSLGCFRSVLSIGPVHRLHHVNWAGEGDVNFGVFLTVWDRLLGTFRLASERPPSIGDIGIEDQPDYPQRYLSQLVMPFITHLERNRKICCIQTSS
jgi:sterol desaturase/sphingolipid hydroxylase (fatty acid hydroxylase superfamily)